ncbi:hypothetical protein SAMN04487968_112131 [Nocardioides terrae]|uniref:FHA domain-containing protein n=1 Tax=Nocardioides terrae TaxID=574651 RepID=A0A1I1MVE4_9ACTN|nr:hypothetical protein SAMN04487968_112131 [Nocardioides terrae]
MVEFCGEEHVIPPSESFTIGRDGDLSVDPDNSYLHRRLIELGWDAGFWWITNVGSRLSVTVSGEVGSLQSVIGPGARLPVVLPECSMLFTAGPTTYEVNLAAQVPVFDAVHQESSELGEVTLGAVVLTDSQFRLVLGLCENVLRRIGSGPADVPTNVAVAKRLGWSITTFNRKLDNVCDKFDRAGVKGLRGGPGRNAVGRRARLVEYAVAARIVRPEHLPLLDQRIVGEE